MAVSNGVYSLIENYIYIYQLDKYVILPVYPDQVQDSLGSTFASENILARTAPIFSYSYSGPRAIQFSFSLHRDLMNSCNWDNIDFIDDVSQDLGDDYIDTLVRYLQAMALPKYTAVDITDTVNKMVNPPLVAVRLGSNIFIKGVVFGDVSVTYSGPIMQDGKYAQIDVSFTVQEVDPQDADTVAQYGSFRSLSTLTTKGLYKS